MKQLLALTLVLVLPACTMIQAGDRWAMTPGKGCIYLADDGTMIAESDGLSINLASLVSGMAGMAAGVFGGGSGEPAVQQLAAGEGCRGVLDTMYGAPPEEE